jgi:hypothetical protein
MSAVPEEAVSPELALVDPELRERLALRDTAPEDAPQAPTGSADAAPPRTQGRRQRRILLAVTAAVLVAVGVAFAAIRADRHANGPASSSAPASRSTDLGVSAAPRSEGAKSADNSSGRDFAWAPARGAVRYQVEIVRNGRVVYSAAARAAHIHLPQRWKSNGRTMTLAPGKYHWYVWPLTRKGQRIIRGSAIVATTFQIAAR